MTPLVQPVIDRLRDRMPVLEGRVAGAAQLATLMAGRAGPHQTPAAHVLPTGGSFGAAETIAGFYRQAHTRAIGVLLWVGTYEATGARAVPQIEDLIGQVITALAGWSPPDVGGDFRVRRSGLVDLRAALIAWQIDFDINDQLRITT